MPKIINTVQTLLLFSPRLPVCVTNSQLVATLPLSSSSSLLALLHLPAPSRIFLSPSPSTYLSLSVLIQISKPTLFLNLNLLQN